MVFSLFLLNVFEENVAFAVGLRVGNKFVSGCHVELGLECLFYLFFSIGSYLYARMNNRDRTLCMKNVCLRVD